MLDNIYTNSDSNAIEQSNSHSIIDSNSSLEKILYKLSGEINVEAMKHDVRGFYDKYKTHNYVAILNFIIDLECKGRDVDSNIANIVKNIDDIVKMSNNSPFNNIDEDVVMKEKLYEIKDFILLEQLRMQQVRDLKVSVNSFSKAIESIESKADNIKKEIEESKKSYITILGIFSAVVLAFVGGLTFSTSVLANMHMVSIYRLIFVICFISLFFGNILYALFNFLRTTISNDNKDNFIVIIFNAIIVSIMILDILVYLFFVRAVFKF